MLKQDDYVKIALQRLFYKGAPQGRLAKGLLRLR